MKRWTIAFLAACLLAGCGDGTGSVSATARPESAAAPSRSPEGAATIDYQVIGSPIVGQPVAIDLQVDATDDSQPLILSFRINDATALQFPEAQPSSVTLAPAGSGRISMQQVRVIPLREGRLFLNVAASVATEDGSLSTAMSIPLTVTAATNPGITENSGQP
jgi:hypothetical protein